MGTNESVFHLVWDETNEVARIEWPPGSVFGLEEARRSTTALIALGRGAVPLLVDMRNVAKFERDAREYFTQGHASARAVALLVGSPVTRMMANFFIGMRRMPVPIKMFDDEADAVRWLHDQG